MADTKSIDSVSARTTIKPAYISHYGIRAQRYREMIDWYQKVFCARIQHENEFLAFMTFDEEHHRLVIFEEATTITKPQNAAGVDHVGYGLASFGDLVATYERLKEDDITPFLTLNHGFTTSLYYRDPDGNEVELSVDNFPTKSECDAFVRSERMEEIGRPPFGYVFDPDELAKRYREGVPPESLARVGLPEGYGQRG